MHVLVTGASSGIGEAIAREYLGRGARVTMVARRRELLESIAASAPDRTHILTRDLASGFDLAAAQGLIAAAEAAQGPIDVLINNAGVQIVSSVGDVAYEAGERLLLLNVHTPLWLTHAALPGMIARRRGTIVDIASMAALAPTPWMYFYNASKGALAAASEGLRAEVKRHGLHVVTVYPGPVESAMEAAGRAAYEPSTAVTHVPTGTPGVLARRIARAVERRRARVIYPRIYALSRHFPNLTRLLLDLVTPPARALKP
ncbi:MAG: SDR family NAD(P)-dependent oxidoreductase [Nannocystaceae bacterium]